VTDDKRLKRLSFRSWHRGTREMDLLLGRFADAYLHGFTAEQLDLYEDILQCSDPDIYSWITHRESLPAAHNNDVMRLLCAFQPGKVGK
jgi:antitoxin CptB